VRYAAAGWGIGELVFEGDVLVHHEPPRAAIGRAAPAASTDLLADRLRAYFEGEAASFDDVAIDDDGATPFERDVCAALRAVPYGDVVTYAELAERAGHPRAQRAAGSFCARNRFSIVVPCHRVVGTNGIGSYGSSGIAYKRRLLELEGVTL